MIMAKIKELARIREDKAKTRQLAAAAEYKTIAQRIKDAIDEYPGIGFRGVIRKLPDVPHGSISSTLYRLNNTRRIKSRKMDGAFRYYPMAYLFADEKKEDIVLRSRGESFGTDLIRGVYIDYIKANPGQTLGKITTGIGTGQEYSTVGHMLKRMVDDGELYRAMPERGPQKFKYYYALKPTHKLPDLPKVVPINVGEEVVYSAKEETIIEREVVEDDYTPAKTDQQAGEPTFKDVVDGFIWQQLKLGSPIALGSLTGVIKYYQDNFKTEERKDNN